MLPSVPVPAFVLPAWRHSCFAPRISLKTMSNLPGAGNFRSLMLHEPGIHPLLVFTSSAGSCTTKIFPEAGESPWRPLTYLCTLGPGINPVAV